MGVHYLTINHQYNGEGIYKITYTNSRKRTMILSKTLSTTGSNTWSFVNCDPSVTLLVTLAKQSRHEKTIDLSQDTIVTIDKYGQLKVSTIG